MTGMIISSAVAAVLALFFIVARNAKTSTTEHGETVLQYHPLIKWGCMGLTIFSALGLTALLFKVPIRSNNELIGVVCLFLALALFGLYFYIEFFTVKIFVGELGIVGTSGWRGTREYTWDEIDQITYSPSSMWFTIKSKQNVPLRIHAMISGVSEFQAYYEAMLPEEKWSKASELYNRMKRAF